VENLKYPQLKDRQFVADGAAGGELEEPWISLLRDIIFVLVDLCFSQLGCSLE